MSEETFGLAAIIIGATLLCGAGVLPLLLPMVDNLIERRKSKRAGGPTRHAGRPENKER